MKEQLERYAELKSVIKEAEAELETIKDAVKSQLEEGTKYDIGIATIELAKGRPKWVYTEPTQIAEETLKQQKKEEEQLGIATQEYGEPYIVCNLKKK